MSLAPSADLRLVRAQAQRIRFTALAPRMRAVDPHLPGHSVRVATLATALGRALGLRGAPLADLAMGALLHDIGKLALPPDVLQAPRRLLAEEQVVVRTHAAQGADRLAALGYSAPVVAVARHHHERMDGSGYPSCLLAPQLALPVRICAVADVWDALSSARSYKPALPTPTCERLLWEMAGPHLDKDVVVAFFDLNLHRAPAARQVG